jgi:hypothetical protein
LWEEDDRPYTPPTGAGSISDAQRRFAFSHCWADCALFNPWKGIKYLCGKIIKLGGPSPQELVMTEKMYDIQQEANAFATNAINELGAEMNERNHAALRHCYASAKYAEYLGCRCAACIGYFREVYQYQYGDPSRRQSLSTTIRTDFNNSIGRRCAGCSGKGNWRGTVSNTTPGECCKDAFKNGKLWLGNTQPVDSDDIIHKDFPYEEPPEVIWIQ